MQKSNKNKRTIISCGRPGVGKSSLGNSLLYGKPNHPKGFESSSDPTKWGVTRHIQKLTKYVDQFNTSLQYIDIPGQGDNTLDMSSLAQSLSQQLNQVTIHATLFLVAAQDDRLSSSEIQSINFIKNFFKSTGLASKDLLWLVITRCGEVQPSQQFIQGKLNALNKFGLSISSDHVVEYDFNLIKFKPFIEKVINVPVDQGLRINSDYQRSLKNFQSDCQQTKSADLLRLEREEKEKEEKIKAEKEKQLKDLQEQQKIMLERARQNEEQIRIQRQRNHHNSPGCQIF